MQSDPLQSKRLLVQSLKGSRAQIVLAFLFASCALDVREVQAWTGLKRETAYEGLRALEAIGLIGKQIAAHGRTIWIPAGDMLPLFGDVPKHLKSTELLDVSKKRTPALNSSSSSLETPVDSLEEEQQEERNQESEKRTPGNPIPRSHLDPHFLAVRQACLDKGIRDPKASVLAHLPHVTPEKVRAHVDAATAEGNPIGTAIHRIQYDWPVPEVPAKESQETTRYHSIHFEEYLQRDPEDESPPAPEYQFRVWDSPVPCADCKHETTQTRFVKDIGQVCPVCFKAWQKVYMGATWRGTND